MANCDTGGCDGQTPDAYYCDASAALRWGSRPCSDFANECLACCDANGISQLASLNPPTDALGAFDTYCARGHCPTASPTAQPSSSPSQPQTSDPSKAPSDVPTNHPTEPSKAPSEMPSDAPIPSPSKSPLPPGVTHNPSNQPSLQPSVSPSADPSNVPSHAPSRAPLMPGVTHSPSDAPSTQTSQPSESPERSPTSEEPTKAPQESVDTTTGDSSSMHLKLFLICKYNDQPTTVYTIYMTLSQYAEIMVDAVLLSIKSVTYHSIEYEDNDSWQYAEWNKAGIVDFKMCKIFNNVQLTDYCMSYDDLLDDSSEDTDGEYTAIATFGIVSDQALNAYQTYIKNQLMSNAFQQAFELNMNQALNDEINANQRRRSLLDDSLHFEVVSIQIVDPTDISTTEYDDSKSFGNDDTEITTIILIVALVLIVILMSIVAMFYAKKRNVEKQEEGKIDE
eukprot:908266_1